jgi:hypothetical protein
MTKFRAGAVVGLAAGYYLGTKAGRTRYEQIRRGIDVVRRRSKAVDDAATAVGRAMAVVDLSIERIHPAASHDAPHALAAR